jgi:hypothetical protein
VSYYYTEYQFAIPPDTDDDEPIQKYIILRFPSLAHANIAEDLRVTGLMNHGDTYTIENFLEDIAEKGISFNIIEPNRIISFSELPSEQATRTEKEKRKEERRHESSIYG